MSIFYVKGGQLLKPTHKFIAAVIMCAPLLLHSALAFSDTDGTWSQEAVGFVSEKGLMGGISDFTFSPQLPVSRASFINALHKMAGSPLSNYALPADVEIDTAYAGAARWAAEKGIITGDFMPDDPLPREQLATLLLRYATLMNDSLPLNSSLSVESFPDAARMHEYSREGMNWCVQAGVLSGLADGSLHPERETTRAEAAVILQRYAELTGSDVLTAETVMVIDEGEAFTSTSGSTTRKFTREITPEGALKERIVYSESTGSEVDMRRVSVKSALPAHILGQYTLMGSSGTIKWYDNSTKLWHEEPLSNGAKPKGMYFIHMDTGAEAIFVTPLSYTDHANSMMEYLPQYDGWLSIRQGSQGYVFSLTTPAQPVGVHADLLAATSDTPLIDWSEPDAEARWANYSLTGSNRWALNGYYYTSPSSYYPYGKNYFHSLPAAHVMGKMLKNSNEAGSRILGLAMLDVMQRQQNALGFIPSRAGSNWLLNEFGIGPGYYDSRFNTDFWVGCVNAADNFGANKWLDAATTYAGFFVSFSSEHHYSFKGEKGEGWLVEDYWSEEEGIKRTHTSLNHQAAEAVFLYRLADAIDVVYYAELADKMVLGIELTADKWIMPDGNFYYSYQPDGTMKEGDYPDLTYYDLVELQRLYTARHNSENPAISRLLKSKYEWMKKQGIEV